MNICIHKLMSQESSTTQKYLQIQKEAYELFVVKNQDYGDAFSTYGPIGVLVRIGDKIQRMVSVTNKGINLVSDESLRDTLIDLHNYAALALVCLKL